MSYPPSSAPPPAPPSESMVVPSQRLRAEAEDLGPTLVAARARCISSTCIFGVGALLLVGWSLLAALTVATLVDEGRSPTMIAIVVAIETLMCAPLGALLARHGWQRRRRMEIAVHERGLALHDRSGTFTLPWIDVIAVYESLEEVDTPIGTRLEGKVVLETLAGRRIVIDRSIPRHVDIGRIAAASAQAALLPRIEANVAFGRRVTFGALALDTHGIHTPDGSHPWDGVAVVRWERLLYRGSYVIQLVDRSIAARIPSEHVANPRVLLAILERYGKLEIPKERLIASVLGVAAA